MGIPDLTAPSASKLGLVLATPTRAMSGWSLTASATLLPIVP
ncbi:MAG: hypothetical protein JCHSAcid_05510 [uncultured Acidilobus sp. JCHS]|jgi:hypothetical protein|nr:MAG: hypothetical protein JCHSAcid_05510 [uncultured Acidilobus sp. JCHS]